MADKRLDLEGAARSGAHDKIRIPWRYLSSVFVSPYFGRGHSNLAKSSIVAVDRNRPFAF